MPDVRQLTGILKLITDDSLLEGGKRKTLQEVVSSWTISWSDTLDVCVCVAAQEETGVE